MKKVILIGCGNHMTETLSYFLKNIKTISIVAFVDIDLNSANTLQQMFQQGKCYTNIKEVKETYNYAILALPPTSLLPILTFLIKKRCQIFVEKPAAKNTKEILSLLKFAFKYKSKIQVGFNFRFSDSFKFVKSRLDEFGSQKILTQIEFFSKHPQKGEWGINSTLEAWLRYNGIHAIDLALFLNGEMSLVSASCIKQTKDKFLLTFTCTHKNGSISVVNLGNATDSFKISAKLNFASGLNITVVDMNEVQETYVDSNLVSTKVLKQKNLYNGWSKAGYGSELFHFFEKGVNQNVPSLSDSLLISKFTDEILKYINE